MSLVQADVGSTLLLKSFFNKVNATGGNNLTLKLFTNNYTPLTTSTASSFTEAAGGGYGAITLTAGSWTVSTSSTPRSASYATQTFTFTGALTGNASIYGYYIVDADGILVYAERAATQFTPTTNGQTYDVTPVYTQTSA